jgi:hypothetical protein
MGGQGRNSNEHGPMVPVVQPNRPAVIEAGVARIAVQHKRDRNQILRAIHSTVDFKYLIA